MKKIRDAKREGKTLAQVLAAVDWAFLEKKEKARNNSAEKGTKALKKYRDNKSNPTQDIIEIKQMVTDIYEMLTKPELIKTGLIGKIANGSWRSQLPG